MNRLEAQIRPHGMGVFARLNHAMKRPSRGSLREASGWLRGAYRLASRWPQGGSGWPRGGLSGFSMTHPATFVYLVGFVVALRETTRLLQESIRVN